MSAKSVERSLFATGDHWADRDQVVFGNLWFEFLPFSTSYELARRCRAGQLSTADKLRIPVDFESVLAVYDDLGDVRSITFDDWWLARGIRLFGYQGKRPLVHPIDALLSQTPDPVGQIAQRAERYIDGAWAEQGRQPSLVISIPLGLSRAQVIEQVEELLLNAPGDQRQWVGNNAKYSIHGKKRDLDSLFRLVKCLLHKSYFPNLKLWEIGVMANLSTTYSARLAKGEGGIEDQQALKILTSRALHRGMMIAENAARGIFPSYDTCTHAVKPDWMAVGDSLEAHQSWHDDQGI